MAVAVNDVNVLSVDTDDLDYPQNTPITVTVLAEAGSGIHGTGGKYHIRMTVTDTTNPALLHFEDRDGTYGDANWPTPNAPQSFSFTVPGSATAGRQDSILEMQARVVSNNAPPFDASYFLGDKVQITL